MGKLIIVSKDKRAYIMDVFLNEQRICTLNPLDEKYFETNKNVYSIYCFSRHSQNNSSAEMIDLAKNVLVEISQGFINPKVHIYYLTNEELKVYNTKNFVNISDEELNRNFIFSNSSNSFHSKKKKNSLTIGQIILALFIFYISINLMISGTKKAMNSDSDITTKYSYTIENQGVDKYGLYMISGKVTNNTNKDVDGLKIEFKCYDDNNNHLDTISSYTQNLAAGDTWVYEASTMLNSDKIKNCDFYRITPFVTIAEFH